MGFRSLPREEEEEAEEGFDCVPLEKSYFLLIAERYVSRFWVPLPSSSSSSASSSRYIVYATVLTADRGSSASFFFFFLSAFSSSASGGDRTSPPVKRSQGEFAKPLILNCVFGDFFFLSFLVICFNPRVFAEHWV